MLEKMAEALLPTKYGEFRIMAFSLKTGNQEFAALAKGDVSGKEGVMVRVHSGCITGDIFGSLRCDCHEQLVESMKKIQENGEGVLIYDKEQEGRGLGLIYKIMSYQLQDKGLDTVEAAHSLGFSNDLRSYEAAAQILKLLGVKSIVLLTNNPDKVEQIERFGIKVRERIPLKIPPTDFNRKYLETKKTKMGHLF